MPPFSNHSARASVRASVRTVPAAVAAAVAAAGEEGRGEDEKAGAWVEIAVLAVRHRFGMDVGGDVGGAADVGTDVGRARAVGIVVHALMLGGYVTRRISS